MQDNRSNEPDWNALARDTLRAIAFQRATRGVHNVGRDGRTRMGCVDLLGCYAVDEMAMAWAQALDANMPVLPAPTEEQAMLLMSERKGWREWLAMVETGEHLSYGVANAGQDDQLGLPL